MTIVRNRSWIAVLAFIAVLAALAWAQAPSAETPSKPETAISSKDAKELFKSVDEILQFASEDTGLPIKREVKRKLIDRDKVQSYVQKNMKDDKDAQRLERSALVLKKFGLLPRDFDLSGFLVKMLREQVAAYYDPKTNTVNLLNWVDADQQKPVLAHELTHALQDQSYGIEKWLREPEEEDKKDPSPSDVGSDEATAARQAVTEGQAMVVLMDYELAPTGRTLLDSPQIAEALKAGMVTGTPDSPSFQSAPIFLKETLTFPYRFGLDFTLALEKAGGKELAYAGAFKNPPIDTRQIMEPQTYLDHEQIPPMKMIDFDEDFAGYERFDIGAMGEFDVDVFVEQFAGQEKAEEMYPQWRGGYYFAGRSRADKKSDKSAPLALVYVSRWSSPAKAAEFAAVYAKSLAKRYQKAEAVGADGKPIADAPPASAWNTLGGNHTWLTDEGPVVIEVRGDSVLITESVDAATTKKVEGDYWGEDKAGAK
jgi:hypothetical protein